MGRLAGDQPGPLIEILYFGGILPLIMKIDWKFVLAMALFLSFMSFARPIQAKLNSWIDSSLHPAKTQN